MVAPLLPPPPAPPTGADATAERLLQSAHELLYGRDGAVFSVREACRRADANVAMVRYCFGNKDGLLLALITRITDSLRADSERLANRLLADQLPGPRSSSESFAAPMGAFHRELLAEGQRAGEVRDVDPALFFFAVVGMSEFIFSARGWLIHGFGLTLDDELVERCIEDVVGLVLAGIGAEARVTPESRAGDSV
jgi:TetR/AcrR family transcriptional regulator